MAAKVKRTNPKAVVYARPAVEPDADPAAIPTFDPSGLDAVPTGSVDDVLGWVSAVEGDDRSERIRLALIVERERDKPRKGVLSALGSPSDG